MEEHIMYMQCAEYNRLKNVVFGDLGRGSERWPSKSEAAKTKRWY
jgi:hypothetical protein